MVTDETYFVTIHGYCHKTFSGQENENLFWFVTPRGLVGRYQRFGGTYYLHLQD
jgi:hypothetical protein